jgi:hypothetical protein
MPAALISLRSLYGLRSSQRRWMRAISLFILFTLCLSHEVARVFSQLCHLLLAKPSAFDGVLYNSTYQDEKY